MNLFVFVVETNNKCQSDSKYIDRFIKDEFRFDDKLNQFQYVYMGSKSRYNNSEVKRKIKEFTSIKRKDVSVHVIYFIDTDRYDLYPEDEHKNQEIKSFCKEKGYELVWFCYNIEHVFLNESNVDNRDKGKKSSMYNSGRIEAKYIRDKLKSKVYSPGSSNILNVLYKYFI